MFNTLHNDMLHGPIWHNKRSNVLCLDQASQAVSSVRAAVSDGTLLTQVRAATGLPISDFAFAKQPTTIKAADTSTAHPKSGENMCPTCRKPTALTISFQFFHGQVKHEGHMLFSRTQIALQMCSERLCSSSPSVQQAEVECV